MASKNQETLIDFTKYCIMHPTERFWQALRNWSEYNYIVGCKDFSHEDLPEEHEDTFYKEGK